MHGSLKYKVGGGNRATRQQEAFTLLELLVVVAIIALLAAIGLPAMRGLTKSQATVSANRQLLDDISLARSRAIAGHTTVYMVFVPPSIINLPVPTDEGIKTQYTKLYGGQYTTYSLVTFRAVGEQPGRISPRYLTPWRTLPNGVFIAPQKFNAFVDSALPTVRSFPTNIAFPFPFATNTSSFYMPYIAFDYLGRLISNKDEYIPLTMGSIFYARDANGVLIPGPADVVETPPGNSVNNSNVIHIEMVTGRARVEKQEVQ